MASYLSPSTQISNGGSTGHIAPANIEISNIRVRWAGISTTTPVQGQETAYSDVYAIAHGGTSPGVSGCGTCISAACRWQGKSIFEQGGLPGNSGWQTQNSGLGEHVSASIQVPNIPAGTTFVSGTVEYIGSNWDGQARTIWINSNGPYTVSGSGGSRTITGSLSSGQLGSTVTCQVDGSGEFQRATVRVIVYWTGTGTTETKTANPSCSTNGGGAGYGAPINDGAWTGWIGLSNGIGSSFSHSIGGSAQAYFQFAYTYTYSYNAEVKTANPSTTVNGQTASYGAAVGNGAWTDWVSLPNNALTPGASNTFSHSVGGSGAAYFQFTYDYVQTIPTRLKVMGICARNNQVIYVPLVDPDDPYLAYNCLRVCAEDDGVPTVYCVDLVPKGDPAGGPLRIYHPVHGILAARKLLSLD